MAQQKKAAPGGRFAELRAEVDDTPYVLTDDIKIRPMSRSQMEEYLAVPPQGKDSVEQRYSVMFGDQWPAIKALFADEPNAVWNLFVKEMTDFFFGKKADDAPGGSSGSSSG